IPRGPGGGDRGGEAIDPAGVSDPGNRGAANGPRGAEWRRYQPQALARDASRAVNSTRDFELYLLASAGCPSAHRFPTFGMPPMTLQPGSRPVPNHPGYELVEKLGAGAFGEVWHARGPGALDVALKFIRLSEQVLASELRSLEAIKNIRHPNLVSL